MALVPQGPRGARLAGGLPPCDVSLHAGHGDYADGAGWGADPAGDGIRGARGSNRPPDLPAASGGRFDEVHGGFAFFPSHRDATKSGWRRNQAKSHRRVAKRPRGSPSSRPARRAAWMVQRETPRASAWAWAVVRSCSLSDGAGSGRSPERGTEFTAFPPMSYARRPVRATVAQTKTPSG